MERIFAALIAAVPKVKTAFNLAGFLGILVAAVTIFANPEAGPIVKFLPLGLAFFLLGLGQVFSSLKSYPERHRAWLIVFVMICGLALIAGFIFAEIYVFNHTLEHDVDVYLRFNGQELREPFKLDYRLPGRGPTEIPGTAGHALIRGVPTALDTLTIASVRCNGYEPKGGPTYDIDRGEVSIEMKLTGPPTPWSIDDFPDPGPHVPPAADVSKPPVVQPSQVLFSFVNRSNAHLDLLLYNCTNHFEAEVAAENRMARWMKRPFPPNSPEEILNSFRKGTGCFVVYVATSDKKATYIGTYNLFQTDKPRLVVEADPEGAKPFRGSFTP